MCVCVRERERERERHRKKERCNRAHKLHFDKQRGSDIIEAARYGAFNECG